jgi:hypothetical protein
MIKSLSILLRMRKVSDEICRENQSTFYVQYRFFENHYEIVWKNIKQADKAQMTILYGACTFLAG